MTSLEQWPALHHALGAIVRELDSLEQQISDTLKYTFSYYKSVKGMKDSVITYAETGNANGDGVNDNVPSRTEGSHEEGQEDQEHQPDDKPQRILHDL